MVITEGSGRVVYAKSKSQGGEGEAFKKGDVIFVGAGEEVVWEAKEGVEAYRAFVEA